MVNSDFFSVFFFWIGVFMCTSLFPSITFFITAKLLNGNDVGGIIYMYFG